MRTSGPGMPVREWTRPAELAAARLALTPAPDRMDLASGADLLTAAFSVVPFIRPPMPSPGFGAPVTAAARAAFTLFLGPATDAFKVLRGEPDDYLVCARRFGGTWRVGAFSVAPTTLTVRFEDLWLQTPDRLRGMNYRVDVLRDAHGRDSSAAQAAGCVCEQLLEVAPDARICLDVARDGGFMLTFTPAREALS